MQYSRNRLVWEDDMASVIGTNVINLQFPERAGNSSQDICSRCLGTGWERVNQGTHNSVRRCTAPDHLRQALLAANVPHLYLNCTLEDFAVPSGSIGLIET